MKRKDSTSFPGWRKVEVDWIVTNGKNIYIYIYHYRIGYEWIWVVTPLGRTWAEFFEWVFQESCSLSGDSQIDSGQSVEISQISTTLMNHWTSLRLVILIIWLSGSSLAIPHIEKDPMAFGHLWPSLAIWFTAYWHPWWVDELLPINLPRRHGGSHSDHVHNVQNVQNVQKGSAHGEKLTEVLKQTVYSSRVRIAHFFVTWARMASSSPATGWRSAAGKKSPTGHNRHAMNTHRNRHHRQHHMIES